MADICLNVSWDVLDACNGFSMDMGGSVLKLIYIDKTEWLEPEQRKQRCKGKLHLTSFTHEDFYNGTAYKFIKEKALIKPGQDKKPPVVCSTGYFVAVNAKTIDKELGIRMQCITETDCFVTALVYAIKNLPRGQVQQKVDEKEIQLTRVFVDKMKETYDNMGAISSMMRLRHGANDIKVDPWFAEGPTAVPFCKDHNIFPLLLVMCGSGFGSMTVYEDGTYSWNSVSGKGGKTWLGVGSLLTGGNDYGTLMEMAEKGCIRPVDMCYNDFTKEASNKDKLESDNPYQNNAEAVKNLADSEPLTAFCFGKAVGKAADDFNKEDLARSYLQSFITDIVTKTKFEARSQKVNHVFFAGGFVNHPFVQRFIYRYFVVSDFIEQYKVENKKPIFCHFLKGGQHYGALGALLNHKIKFVPIKETEVE